MKQKLFALLLLFACVGNAWGLLYQLNTTAKTATVVPDRPYTMSDSQPNSGNVVIPETVQYNNETYTVTSIGYQAFKGCTDLTSITIPEGVTSLDLYAFEGCTRLTSIVIPEGVTSIGYGAFRGCTKLSSATLPNSLTTLGRDVFQNCSSLTEPVCSSTFFVLLPSGFKGDYSIPDGIKVIYEAAFSGCAGLTSIVIPEGVTSIESSAFSGCTGLTSITIPEGVTSIGGAAFSGCTGLTSIVIPESVTSIGDGAFSGCSGLKSMTLPFVGTSATATTGSQTTLFGVIFGTSSGTGLTLTNQLYYNSAGTLSAASNRYIPTRLRNIIITGGENIFNYAFYGCSMLESITLPDCVTSIDRSAFNGCSGLTSLNIPDGVTYIGDYAFSGCSGLTSLDVPTGVTSIGNSAFSGCSGLTSLDIPDTSIGKNAFEGCSGLEWLKLACNVKPSIDNASKIPSQCAIFVPASMLSEYREEEYWSDHSAQFIAIDAQKEYEVTVEAKTTMSAIHEEVGEDNLNNVVSLKVNGTINSYDLMIMRNKMTNLKHLDLSDARILNCSYEYYQGYHSVQDTWTTNAFSPNLRTLKLPNTLVTCNYGVMRNMTKIKELTIPASVTSLGDNFAEGNTSLQKVYIADGSQLTTIGSKTFYGCTSLEYIELEKVSNMKSLAGDCFTETNGKLVLTVPACVTSIVSPDLCTSKNVIFADGDEVLTYRDGASQMNSVYVGRNVSGPGPNYFFLFNPNKITIGDQVTRIPSTFVKVNKNDTKTYISGMKNVTEIASESFVSDGVANMVYVDYTGTPASWASIKGIEHLTSDFIWSLSSKSYVSLKINGTSDFDFDPDDDIEEIPPYAFYKMYDITTSSLHIPESVKSIGDYAFYRCPVAAVTIGNSVENIGRYAFNECSKLATLTVGNSVKTIGEYAFNKCTSLTEVNLPSTLTTMGSNAFAGCNNMTSCVLPTNSQLTGIPAYAFDGCTALQKMDLPVSVQRIGAYAFRGCTGMEETRIPSSIRSIGSYAFNGSSKLNDVYTYTVIPQKIDQNTFSTYHTATLHVPAISYYNYYYDTQWSQFLNLVNFNEPYTYVFIDKDFEINTDKKIIEGCPLFEILNTAGLKLKGAASQTFSEIRLKADRLKAASLIARAELTANTVYIDIDVQKNMWEFFTFPFDVDLTQVQKEGNYVFRRYDGNLRAQNGSGGWQDITDNKLKAGVGYIFRTDTDGTLSIPFTDPNLQAVNVKQALEGYTKSEGDTPAKDKNWNFVGNPYTSYYNINDLDYSAPIVCWDVQQQKYVAYRPGDDDFVLRPFQPFFLQKGENVDYVGYAEEARVTGTEAEEELANGAKRRARARRMNQNRQLINLTLSDGKTEDKTRVVFNNEQLMTYEIGCDVVKMASLANTFQLYTVDNNGVKYAINERPQGDGFVQLGYVAPEAGTFTLSATRMDVPVIVHDNVEGITFNLSEGSYSFQTEAGSFADRFAISMAEATAIDNVTADENAAAGNENTTTYDISGRAVSKDAKGIVIKGGKKVLVK